MKQSTDGFPRVGKATWWDRVWDPFWVLPGLIAASSLLLGLGVPAFDEALDNPLPWVFRGGDAGARALLATIAGAMISVTGLVFSITMVILQLASSQFTPRIIGSFLDSRITQVTLGLFTGSFLYALSVLRTVRGGDGVPVPQTGVAIAYLYVVGAVVMFLAFIHHITESVRVSKVMTQVRRRSVASVRLSRPEGGGAPCEWSSPADARSSELRMDDRCGYLTVLDGDGLVHRATTCDVVVELDVTPGDFLQSGQLVGRVWGREGLTDEEASAFTALLHVSGERDFHIDPGFGVRQLVDIAERALSPGVNDPTTAIQAVNELHVVLRALTVTADPSPCLTDDRGVVRGVYRPQTFASLLSESVEELAHYGKDSVRMLPRLRHMVTDLASAALPEHRRATRDASRHVDAVMTRPPR